MVTTYINSIHAEGIFGRFDIKQKFGKGINIIYGKNGAGKTTLLHILANALSGDFDRFKYLAFKKITLSLSNRMTLTILNEGIINKPEIKVTLNKEIIYPESSKTNLNYFLDVLTERLPSSKRREFSSFLDTLRRMDNRSEQHNLIESFFDNYSKKSNSADDEIYGIYKGIFDSVDRGELSRFSMPVAYFPAFRTMIEAWAAANLSKEPRGARFYPRTTGEEWRSKATEQARDWFGAFIPSVNFPSLVEIEEELSSEILHARNAVWNRDRNLLSQAFSKVFSSLSEHSPVTEKGEDILRQLETLFSQVDASPMGTAGTPIFRELRKELSNLRKTEGSSENAALRILLIYRDVLESSLQVQQASFKSIQEYLGSVNEFLENKHLDYKLEAISPNRQPSIGVQFEDGVFNQGLRTLSSGERQIITLIYASTHMSQQNVVLIDEPEISLHIDWQRMLISKMAEHIGDRQIIACTHSPVIAADYPDQMKEFQFKPTKLKSDLKSEYSNEEEIAL